MAVAWRIVKAAHIATAFNGEGAAKFGGRWNSRGVRVVDASGSPALAALETLVHLNPSRMFSYKLFTVEIDDKLVERYAGPLPRNWRTQPPSASTQRIGDDWARALRSVALAVPSAIIPEELNYLLNPAHPDFRRLRISRPRPFAFDSRLL